MQVCSAGCRNRSPGRYGSYARRRTRRSSNIGATRWMNGMTLQPLVGGKHRELLGYVVEDNASTEQIESMVESDVVAILETTFGAYHVANHMCDQQKIDRCICGWRKRLTGCKTLARPSLGQKSPSNSQSANSPGSYPKSQLQNTVIVPS